MMVNVIKIKMLLLILFIVALVPCNLIADDGESSGKDSFVEWLFKDASKDDKAKTGNTNAKFDNFSDLDENGIDDRFEKTKQKTKEPDQSKLKTFIKSFENTGRTNEKSGSKSSSSVGRKKNSSNPPVQKKSEKPKTTENQNNSSDKKNTRTKKSVR